MDEVFLRQSEAWEFVRSIADAKEKLLTEVSLGKALAFLASDPAYAREFSRTPLDALTFARAMNAALRDTQVIGDILRGAVKTVDDLSPFP
jgi:hypothetical protein